MGANFVCFRLVWDRRGIRGAQGHGQRAAALAILRRHDNPQRGRDDLPSTGVERRNLPKASVEELIDRFAITALLKAGKAAAS